MSMSIHHVKRTERLEWVRECLHPKLSEVCEYYLDLGNKCQLHVKSYFNATYFHRRDSLCLTFRGRR